MDGHQMFKRQDGLADRIAQFRWRSPQGDELPYGIGCAYLSDDRDKEKLNEALRTLEAAYEAGFRYFDTSANYGASESVLGGFLAAAGRSELFIATKLARFDPQLPPHQAATHVADSVERSLARLRVDYVDLIQIHDIYSLGAVGEAGGVLEALAKLRERGIVRAVGMATRPLDLLRTSLALPVIDCVLTYADYTPLGMGASQLLDAAGPAGKPVINGSPLAGQLISGTDPRMLKLAPGDDRHAWMERAVSFYELCRKHGIAAVDFALRFPLREPRIAMNLTGPATLAQLKSTLRAITSEESETYISIWREWAAKHAENWM